MFTAAQGELLWPDVLAAFLKSSRNSAPVEQDTRSILMFNFVTERLTTLLRYRGMHDQSSLKAPTEHLDHNNSYAAHEDIHGIYAYSPGSCVDIAHDVGENMTEKKRVQRQIGYLRGQSVEELRHWKRIRNGDIEDFDSVVRASKAQTVQTVRVGKLEIWRGRARTLGRKALDERISRDADGHELVDIARHVHGDDTVEKRGATKANEFNSQEYDRVV
ncbi:hypothetical protein BKA93DRAFT_749030 [Sparassis latifolia]